MKKLKTILQSRWLFKLLCLISIIYSLYNIYLIKSNNIKISGKDKITLTGKVTQYEIDGNKVKINLNSKEKTIIYYYFKTKKEKEEFAKKIELGLILKVKGTKSIPSKNTIPNGFNYRNYLKYNGINYFINSNKITITSHNTSVFYYIKNKIIKRIDKIDNTGYLRTFILGDKTLMNEETIKKYQQNGIIHLFSISGMHVSLIASILMFILNKVSYSNIYKYSIIIPILLFYLFLTGVGTSILRTVIMYITFAINKIFNLKIKKIDLMLIVLIIAIIIKPTIICDMGFQYSYTISFTLIILNKKISKIKNKLLQSIYTSLICFLTSFPICIYYFSEINIISILLNLIIIPIVSIIIFPLTLITFIFPFIYPFYEKIIFILEKTNEIINNIKIFELILSKPSIILIIIYYILIYTSLYKLKYIYLFLTLIFIHSSLVTIDNNFLITFLDVGQGDSIFIKLPNNKSNILIDTGGIYGTNKAKWKNQSKKYSIAENKIIPYLKSIGIRKIQNLIITHGDFDHMGEAINLVNNFKVDKVIFNCGEFNELEHELIKVLNKKKIPYYSCIKELNIENNKLYFLNNKDYGNENDNSNVIYTELNNYKFLFMGDAGVDVEEDLIKKYNLQDIDVLKVGHHGSKTSSGKNFIDEINPKYSIISVGKNNRYGHPNKEVLNTLEDSKLYRTDQDGSIMFKIKNDKLQIETCAP